MKAVGVAAPEDLAAADALMTASRTMLLIDAKPPKGGGPARRQRPSLRLAPRARFLARAPWLLSGGLDAANVAEAIALTGARGVDVSSGVESAPGIKDERKIAAFVAAARAGLRPRDRRSSLNGQARKAQFLPHGPQRARAIRHLWRALRRGNADAADPLAGEGLRGGQGRSVLPGRARPFPQALCRTAEPALFRRAAHREARRGKDLFQARRAQPHRRAQDQQRARPDPARPPHGQGAHHRGNGRRPARRRHRDRLRPLRPAMRRLHGRGRRRAAEAERVPHEDAGRRGPAGRGRRAHAEGRDERGLARLGHQCRATRSTASAPPPGRTPTR